MLMVVHGLQNRRHPRLEVSPKAKRKHCGVKRKPDTSYTPAVQAWMTRRCYRSSLKRKRTYPKQLPQLYQRSNTVLKHNQFKETQRDQRLMVADERLCVSTKKLTMNWPKEGIPHGTRFPSLHPRQEVQAVGRSPLIRLVFIPTRVIKLSWGLCKLHQQLIHLTKRTNPVS